MKIPEMEVTAECKVRNDRRLDTSTPQQGQHSPSVGRGNRTRAFRSPQRAHTLTPQSLSLTSGYRDSVLTGRRHLDGKRPGPEVPYAPRPKTSRYSRKSPASYLRTSRAASSSQDDTYKLRLPIRPSQSKVSPRCRAQQVRQRQRQPSRPGAGLRSAPRNPGNRAWAGVGGVVSGDARVSATPPGGSEG